MGNTPVFKKVGFEDIRYIQDNINNYILINTLKQEEQQCIILGTISPKDEEKIINLSLQKGNDRYIVIYGKNSLDETICKKYNDLVSLGFKNVFIYPGGLFEWLCLQDIYGNEEFKTSSRELDILKFKPPSVLNSLLLTND